jgi:hypothetical protein
MSAASVSLFSQRSDRLVSSVKATGSKLPFVRPPPTIASDFSKVRLRLEPSTALPANSNSPFSCRLTLPLYCIMSNLFLSVTVEAMPAHVQAIAGAGLYMFDEINLLAQDGRTVWQQRPESAFVKISQCWPRELRRTAMALVGWSSSDQATNATQQTTYLVPLIDFPFNDLTSSASAIDGRSLAGPLQIQCKVRASSDWCFAAASGGDPTSGVVISSIQVLADYYDLTAASLSALAASYVPRSVIGRSFEIQTFDIPAAPSGTTSSVQFIASLTGLSGASCNFFAYIVSAATGVDGAQTTPLGFDSYSFTASGTQLVSDMTWAENALEIVRLMGTSAFGSEADNANPNIITWSNAVPGYATDVHGACGSLPMRTLVNPQLSVWSSQQVTTARKLVVVSEIISLLSYSGAYGAQKISLITDAL